MQKIMSMLGLLALWLLPAGGAMAQFQTLTGLDALEAEIHHSPPRLIGVIGDDLWAGIEFDLNPEWKLYWRSPGEAGLPPKLNWQAASRNIQTARLEYPVPLRMELLGLTTIGYQDKVAFPIKLDPIDPAQPVRFAGHLDYLACAKICVPLRFDFDSDQTANIAAEESARLLAKARASLPLKQDQAAADDLPIKITGLSLRLNKDQAGKPARWQLTLDAHHALGWNNQADIFVETSAQGKWNGGVWQRPIIAFNKQNARFVTTIESALLEQAPQQIRITLTSGGKGVEAEYEAANIMDQPILEWQNSSVIFEYALIFAIALIGGLILNIMPCVLPVLSIKLLGVIKAQKARSNLIYSAAGIIASFWALGIVIAIFKRAGHQLGWGVQFQSPLFLSFMIAILLLFSANLLGLWHIRLPRRLANYAANKGVNENSKMGAFGTGIFATLLATPCSAPFLGTAVSFALAGSYFDLGFIFTGLGLGMAIPYFIFFAFPALIGLLPKPGRWLGFVKPIMAIPLILTAIWLGSIILTQLAFTQKHEDSSIEWQAFDPDQIDLLVEQGQTIFVHITADWCLTCQYNANFILENQIISAQFTDLNIVMMKGDWTSPNPEIADFLRKYNRYAIPFDALYAANMKTAYVFPELLSVNNVQAGLDKLGVKD
ncbi:MAG: protein-disulfide reductase DsbD family protein [Alphaproteobacteria bacterium]